MNASRLVKLDDTDFTLSDPGEDIRGRWVIDRNGIEIGYIDTLLIDDQARKVRLLQITSSGIFGAGEQRFLLPVDAVTRLTADEAVIDQSRERIAGAPIYHPNLGYDRGYYSDVYGYYGYSPYWSRSEPTRAVPPIRPGDDRQTSC